MEIVETAESENRRNIMRGWFPPSHSLSERARFALSRRLRLFGARLRYPRAQFGSRCDVRPGLSLLIGARGRVTFGEGCVLDRSFTAEAHGRLTVGAGTIFGHHCTIVAMQEVEIGPDCLIANLVDIRDNDHCFDRLDTPTRAQGANVAPVKIGRNVWIATKVTIVKGVAIGDNAIIGANAVVTKDIPANAIAVGVPARVVRYRE